MLRKYEVFKLNITEEIIEIFNSLSLLQTSINKGFCEIEDLTIKEKYPELVTLINTSLLIYANLELNKTDAKNTEVEVNLDFNHYISSYCSETNLPSNDKEALGVISNLINKGIFVKQGIISFGSGSIIKLDEKLYLCMPYSWVKITDIREKTLMIKACF